MAALLIYDRGEKQFTSLHKAEQKDGQEKARALLALVSEESCCSSGPTQWKKSMEDSKGITREAIVIEAGECGLAQVLAKGIKDYRTMVCLASFESAVAMHIVWLCEISPRINF